LVFLFWFVAAALVVSAHRVDAYSSAAGCTAAVIALVATGGVYTRLIARDHGVTHALGVGIAWFVLSMAAEIVMTTHAHHGWFSLLGSPTRPLLRNLLMFVWIFSPALFARRGANS
jgi:hypothetical protein